MRGSVICQAHTAPRGSSSSKAREKGERGTSTSTSPYPQLCYELGLELCCFFILALFTGFSILCRCIFFRRYPKFICPTATGMVWYSMVWCLEPETCQNKTQNIKYNIYANILPISLYIFLSVASSPVSMFPGSKKRDECTAMVHHHVLQCASISFLGRFRFHLRVPSPAVSIMNAASIEQEGRTRQAVREEGNQEREREWRHETRFFSNWLVVLYLFLHLSSRARMCLTGRGQEGRERAPDGTFRRRHLYCIYYGRR